MPVSPFPFHALPRYQRADLAVLDAALAWLGAGKAPARALGLALTGWRLTAVTRRELDSGAGLAWLGRAGARALLSVPGEVARALGQRLLAAPVELAAPRPLTAAEQAVVALACAEALDDATADAQVEPWQPFPDLATALARTEREVAGWPCAELALEIDGRAAVVRAWIPSQLVHARPARAPRVVLWWDHARVPAALVVGAARLATADVLALRPRDVVLVDAPAAGAELRLGRGAIAVRAVAGEPHGTVESGYRRRVEPLPDDLTVELSVVLGGVALSLRQLSELAVGQVVPLGRPLRGPFELRAGDQVIGTGELVDVDGELGVRVATLTG
ncbi:MAG: FliM/FliN family flagellar motor switch protein [Kofleriaceae bacterium]